MPPTRTPSACVLWTALSFAACAAARPPPSPGATSAPLPSPTAIVARYDEALGGVAALRRHTSITVRGELEVRRPKGVVVVAFIRYGKAPFLRLERYTLPGGGGEDLRGFDGEHAWHLSPQGAPELLEGDEVLSAKRDADFYYPVTLLSWFRSMETVGIEELDGRACYHLRGINLWGRQNDHFYDRETGLLAAYEFDSTWRGGPGLEREIFTGYRRIGDVLVSTEQSFEARSKAQTGTWEPEQRLTSRTITFDDVEPASLEPPAAVRDLIARREQAGASRR